MCILFRSGFCQLTDLMMGTRPNNRETNKKNVREERKIQPSNNLDANSIDNKAKQFADFFNGEIMKAENNEHVNLDHLISIMYV